VLWAIGIVWLAPVWIDSRLAALMLAWNVIVAVAVSLDAMRLPRPGQLSVTRRWGGPLTIGTSATASLELKSTGAVAIVAILTDYLHPRLARDLVAVRVAAAPGRSSTASFEVAPLERGDVETGDVVVEWRSAWGLFER
jgi:uncharacterized protein (DUF58 family)